jgi:hypothetical protein
MVHEIPILVRQNVGVWNKIIVFPPKLFLHLNIVEAESIFPSDLIGIREVIDPLVLVQSLIEISFASTA